MQLTDTQQDIIDFCNETYRGALYVGVGLGKTYALLKFIESLPEDDRRTLIVLPASISLTVWQSEIEKWGVNLSINTTYFDKETAKGLMDMWADGSIDLLTVSYDSLHNVEEFLPKVKYHIIFDESQFVKSHSTNRFKTLVRIYKYNSPQRVYLLSGTPIVNGYEDLYSQIYLIDEGYRLGTSYNYFVNHFSTSKLINYKYLKITFTKKQKQKIQDVIRDIIFVKLSDERDVLFIQNKVEMTKQAKTLYKQVENFIIPSLQNGKQIYKHKNALNARMRLVLDDMFDELDYIIESKLEQIQKLRQVASGFIYDGKGNVRYVNKNKINLLDTVYKETYENMVVFYQYTAEKEEIIKWCKKSKLAYETELTVESLKRWDNNEINVLILHPKSASYGFNLQYGGRIVVWYTLSYSLTDFKQGNARVNRMGQKKQVIVHMFSTIDTVDEAIGLILTNKAKELNLFLKRMSREYQKGEEYELWVAQLQEILIT